MSTASSDTSLIRARAARSRANEMSSAGHNRYPGYVPSSTAFALAMVRIAGDVRVLHKGEIDRVIQRVLLIESLDTSSKVTGGDR
jgi:hypothetical protein